MSRRRDSHRPRRHRPVAEATADRYDPRPEHAGCVDATAAVLDAVARVHDRRDESLVLRSSADRRRWVQLSHVPGEDKLLCEAVGSDYLGWRRKLPDKASAVLECLGWQEVPDAYLQWADVATPEDRQQLAAVLTATLVQVLGHDADQGPAVGPA